MVDLLLCVDDPVVWHEENLRRNPEHYSFLRWMGAGTIARVQMWGAGVYYNTHVKLTGSDLVSWSELTLSELHRLGSDCTSCVCSCCSASSQTFKYGVVATPSLLKDLKDWNQLHVAGRLHKPVLPILGNEDPVLAPAIRTNRQQALLAACLLLPPSFTEIVSSNTPSCCDDMMGCRGGALPCLVWGCQVWNFHLPALSALVPCPSLLAPVIPQELFSCLAQLSYMDDIRWTMGLGENPNKVSNIVRGSYSEFRQLYAPIMPELGLQPAHTGTTAAAALEFSTDDLWFANQRYENSIRESRSPHEHLKALPAAIRRNFPSLSNQPDQQQLVGGHQDLAAGLALQLRGIVRASSRAQAFKGLLTAGVSKSLGYVAAKFTKARVSPSSTTT